MAIPPDHKSDLDTASRQSMIKAVTGALYTFMEIERPLVAKHCRRVADWSIKIGALSGLSDAEQEELECAALLHDIGFIHPSLQLLQQLINARTTDERATSHPVLGYSILSRIPGLDAIAQAVLSHHEKYNGTGFPQKQTGEAIPLMARIIAVADLYDLESNPGVAAVNMENVRKRISRERGIMLDPDLAGRLLFILTTSDDLVQRDNRVVEIPFSALRPGMVLSRDLCAIDGTVLLRAGAELRQQVLDRVAASAKLEWLLTTAHVDVHTVR